MENEKILEAANAMFDALFELSIENKKPSEPHERFGGWLDTKPVKSYIKEIIVNKPAVIVFWSNGEKTVSVCDKKDVFDIEKGIMVCVLKRLLGNKEVSRLLKDWALDLFIDKKGQAKRTLADIRRINKKKNK